MKMNVERNKIIILMIMFLTSCEMIWAQYEAPFTGPLNVKLQKIKDQSGETETYASGTNPLYFYNSNNRTEYFYAGQIEEDDHSIYCGDLKMFKTWGWVENIGIIRGESFIRDGIQALRVYSNPQFDRTITYIEFQKEDAIHYQAKSDAEFNNIIREYRKRCISRKWIPQSIQLLSDNISPRVFTRSYANRNNNSSFSQPGSQLTPKGKLVALATFLAALGIAKSAIDSDSGSSSYSSSSAASAPSNVMFKSNVEIVDWWTLGSLAISHAKVQLRNKNNYDVNVTVGLYQGKWSDGKIIYNGSEQSDYISGVSDNYSTTIRVKANSIRTVYLKADSRGRPTNIRISSVR